MRRITKTIACAWLALLWASSALGQAVDPYDPPAGYYATAIGTGASLKSQLHNIIDGHTVRSYDAARTILPETDEDPNNPNRMLLVYNRSSHQTAWDNAATWNREHVWPESRGVGSGGPDQSDLHMLRPSLTTINSDRGNLNFGGAFGQPYGDVTDNGATVWYPGDADAGMVARQSFYMAVRYDGSDGSTTDLELASGNTSMTNRMGDLDRMLEWHFAAPPDSYERRRNQKVYSDYQNNRNPFVDRPEYAWSVFVNQTNDSSLTLQGAAPSATGATSVNVDLGRILVGAAVPSAQAVTLNKAGLNGTYYQASTAGLATSSVTGRYNAFRTGVTGSKSIYVGLNTTTATPGLRAGTVTIDNLDVTTGGGGDRGANDGNDVIDVSLSVLSHANPSFSGAGDVDTLTYDFGTLSQGAADPLFSFDLFNLEATIGYTAGLDLDAINGSGDVNAFTTDLAPFNGAAPLAAGSSRAFTATLDTSVLGAFAATYTLGFSDENLPGATSLENMTLTLTGAVEASVVESADFDSDGVVDGADFLAWQLGVGAQSATLGHGDANGDLMVDGSDLAVWQEQYPASDAAAASTVPEPSTLLILAPGLSVAAGCKVRRGSAHEKGRRHCPRQRPVGAGTSDSMPRRPAQFPPTCREL